MPPSDSALAATLPADGAHLGVAQTAVGPANLISSFPPPASAARTTVLPRVEGEGEEVRLVAEQKNRYQPIKMLGSGGMGEVELVHDEDIARKVAVKRLLPEAGDPALLARFVDEVRCVGRLEHPNIVPIHDVGVDEHGRYFFVMKYVEGETLEVIIRKLAAGDPDYLRQYTFERRVEIFKDVLHALAYAHEHGVLHRDVKPANVMVGRHGEVVLMDWGIAKPVAAARDLARCAHGTLGEASDRGRMFMTHVGDLVGTPAYMSPEQARGEVDILDARSDLYSACVLFHELVTLRHYLADHATIPDVLAAIASSAPPLRADLHRCHVAQGAHPPELLYFVCAGLAKDPAKRYQSATEMIDLLMGILEGKIHVHCTSTMAKRMLREAARAVDRSPRLMFWSLIGAAAAVVFTLVQIVRMIAS